MPSSTLTIEEVYGGGGNSGALYKNDYVVLHNETNAAIDLTGYSVQYASATSTTGNFNTTTLSGSVAAGGYFLIQEAQGAGGSANLPTPDLVATGGTGILSISGTTGKIALVHSTTALPASSAANAANVVDFLGWGTANTYEGSGNAPGTTNTTSVIRGNFGNLDTDNNATDFTTVTPDQGMHAPFNGASTAHPANGGGATSLAIANVSMNEGDSGQTPFTFTVTRSGDLSGATTVNYATSDGTATTADGDYVANSGTLTFAAGESSHTFNVLVNGDTKVEPNETFNVALSGQTTGVTYSQQTATGTIVNDDVTVVGIGDIQGASQTSPYAGASVTTQGIVTAIKTGSGGGFYIQDDPATGPAGASHGLFVFTAATPTGVAVGDAVTVSGTVTEYNAGNNNLSLTELNSPTFNVTSQHNTVTPIVIGGAGHLNPPTETIAAATPYDPSHSGADFYESLEGQLVTIHNAQAVDATYSGSTWVVPDSGLESTGINARGGITVSATDFNPERIQVYSTGLNASMGEQLGDVTGVITYYSSNNSQDPNIGGEYELVPTATITPPGSSVSAAPTLPLETTTLVGDANHLSLGAYNVENLGPVEPGVDQSVVDARFAALGADIAHNLHAPDILGLEEIQDNDGQNAGADLGASATLNKLIAAIHDAGGPTYQYVEIDPATANTNGGAPNGNIRSAYLYNPERVGYVANSATLINDPNLSDGDAFTNSRHPLVAQFTFNGQTVTAIDVHDYARSGSQELFGANQPPTNSGDQRRVDQTAAVEAYVKQVLSADPHADVTVQGDFNGFQFEPTLTQLTPAGGGYLENLADLLAPQERYSTTFEGDAQEIDNLLVSPSLETGAQFDIVHLNTGQPAAAQASDHDPIVSLLSIPAQTMPAGGGGDTMPSGGDGTSFPPAPGVTQSGGSAPGQLQGSDLGDSLTAGSAGDTLLGGGGNDSLVGGIGHDLIYGNMGDDRILVAAGSQGDSVYGGQGQDLIDASHSNAPNYLSGDIGDDTIMSGAGFETVLGGVGNDLLVGGARAGAGSLQLLFGNMGDDTISYAGAGSVIIHGGQDNDTLSVTTSGQGQTHQLFGDLGDDVLTASGGYNVLYGNMGADTLSASNGYSSLYGGQDSDVLSTYRDNVGRNYLSGDLGDDTITTGFGGSDTVRGGPGADTITLSPHNANAPDTVLVGVGESTAAPGAGETNLDHITGFNFASDHIVVTGHATGTAANVTTYSDTAANSSEAQAFSSAYLYAYGDGTSAHTAHVGATEYLAVGESYGGANAIYVFTADHTAVAFTGVTASSFQAGAIVGG